MADLASLPIVVTIQLLALTAPGAGPGLAVWRRARLPAVFLPVCVLGSTLLIGYAMLFLWLISQAWATGVVRAVCAASVLLAAWQIRSTKDRYTLVAGGALLLVMAVGAWALLLVLGAVPTDASSRFAVGLPNDNVLPRYLADRFYDPKVTLTSVAGTLDGIYLTSDRPPLQSMGLLALWALVPGYRFTTYQVYGTLCQIGWIPALCCLCAALQLDRRERAFVFVGVAGSGFTLLNTIYTWPKLLSGWLLLAGLAVWLLRDEAATERRWTRIIVGSVLVALSALAHGGVAFSLLLLPVLAILIDASRRPSWRAVLVGAAAGLVVVSPWIAYQRFVDPPGNRLVKWHLAGVDAVDARGVGRTLLDQYVATPVSQLLAARLANVKEQWLIFDSAPSSDWRTWLQWQQFFHLIPALDTLVVGLPALVAFSRGKGPRDLARSLAWFALLTWIVWIFLMFLPGSAVLHQGSYANVLLLFALGALGLARLTPRMGVTLLVAHVALFVTIWLGISSPPVAPRPVWLYAGTLLFAAAIAALARLPQTVYEPAP
jgi:hypothetical protein